jgi:hypothetical protein
MPEENSQNQMNPREHDRIDIQRTRPLPIPKTEKVSLPENRKIVNTQVPESQGRAARPNNNPSKTTEITEETEEKAELNPDEEGKWDTNPQAKTNNTERMMSTERPVQFENQAQNSKRTMRMPKKKGKFGKRILVGSAIGGSSFLAFFSDDSAYAAIINILT